MFMLLVIIIVYPYSLQRLFYSMFLCVKYEFISPNFLTTSTWKFIQLHTSIIIAYCNSLPINLKC